MSLFSRSVLIAFCGASVLCLRAAAVSTLRVCADPNNLPFSNRNSEGFENKIASLLAAKLDTRLEYVWWVERGNLVKNTLDANRCDVLLGVPPGFGHSLTTRPYYRSTYVFVYRRDRGLKLTSLDDPQLGKLRIGIHVVGDGYVPPGAALARRGITSNIRGFTILGSAGEPDPKARLITAVEEKQIDVAIAWGPLAGYFAQKQPSPLVVTPIEPDRDSPAPFTYDMAMAVRRDGQRLRDELDRAVAENKAAIHRILKSYGVPEVTAR